MLTERISRRCLLRNGALVALGAVPTVRALASLKGPSLRIGLITDAHYANVKARGTRFYQETPTKLAEALQAFQRERVDSIIEMGDLVDTSNQIDKAGEIDFLKTIFAQLQTANVPIQCVLGNHCVEKLSKRDFLSAVGQADPHFSFDKAGWHFVILDACYRADGVSYDQGNYQWFDAAIPAHQRNWLRNDLAATNLPTVVFVHQRLDVPQTNPMGVADAAEIRKILSGSRKVTAVFQGHNHVNDLRLIDDVPYVSLRAMVEGSGPQNNAYSILHLHKHGTLRLEGFRRHREHEFARIGLANVKRHLPKPIAAS